MERGRTELGSYTSGSNYEGRLAIFLYSIQFLFYVSFSSIHFHCNQSRFLLMKGAKVRQINSTQKTQPKAYKMGGGGGGTVADVIFLIFLLFCFSKYQLM